MVKTTEQKIGNFDQVQMARENFRAHSEAFIFELKR